MNVRLILLAGAMLMACDSLPDPGGVGGADGGDNERQARWPNEVYTVEIGGLYEHDLSEGKTVDLSWADRSGNACWPGTENSNFNGNHVFFATVQPADTYLTVSAIPEPGLDISLYLYQVDLNEAPVPPDVDGVLSCSISADVQYNSNPGQVEYVRTLGYPRDVHVLIGVAGANDTTEGTFRLELFAEPRAQ